MGWCTANWLGVVSVFSGGFSESRQKRDISSHILASGEYLESGEWTEIQEFARLFEQSSLAEVSPHLANGNLDPVPCS